ncbi:unnamed protein product [Caenorhabditis angaria]|uniref:Protein FAM32A n=1 Tax=Caenorhabditis angaria TaxID=860376 RepID=A0A9P1IJ51_9PELO|nr:unnamed protein product [Caenorhabditis angaria]
MAKETVIKGGLKLKKGGDVFKKKKKSVDPKQIDITIKRSETASTSTSKKTDAEKRFEERRQANMAEKMLKRAAESHREKVEKFNKQMEEMTEFNDIPKVSWTK